MALVKWAVGITDLLPLQKLKEQVYEEVVLIGTYLHGNRKGGSLCCFLELEMRNPPVKMLHSARTHSCLQT